MNNLPVINNPAPIEVLDMHRISSYLKGSSSPTDAKEVDKLNLLLRNYSKAGNMFLGFQVYKTMERVAKLMDALSHLEEKLYSKDSIRKMVENDDNQNMFLIIQQINTSINNSLTFINNICNKNNTSFANVVNNVVINYTPDSNISNKENKDIVLDRTQRENIRAMAQKILTNLVREAPKQD
jgi:hypothetical protein